MFRKFVVILMSIIPVVAFGQLNQRLMSGMFNADNIPFEKILQMTTDEMKSIGFKYNKKKNSYTVKHFSTKTKIDRFMTGKNYQTPSDYEIFIYMGKKGKAIMQVKFFDQILYGGIVKWIDEYHEDAYFIKGYRAGLHEFEYNNLKIRLVKTDTEISTTYLDIDAGMVLNTFSDVHSITPYMQMSLTEHRKRRYPAYHYTVFTEEKPDSKWLKKQQQKMAKKKIKKQKIENIL